MSHRRTQLFAFAGSLLLMLATACSDSSSDSRNNTPPLTASTYASRISDTYCKFAEKCGWQFSSCQEDMKSFRDKMNAAAAAGTWKLNETAAKACLQQLPQMSCDLEDPFKLLPDCAKSLEGQIQPSGPCDVDYECANGWCQLSGDQCAKGACVAKVAVGADCSSDRHCAAGSTCGTSTCVALAQLGEACGTFELGDCVGTTVCAPVDPNDFEKGGKCSALVGAGGVCTDAENDICKPGHYCDIPNGSQAGTCKPFLKAGATCPVDSNACGPLDCLLDTRGASTGTCSAPKAPGESCVVDEDQCAYPAYCSKASGKCIDGADLGETCGNMEENTFEWRGCKQGYCDLVSSTGKCEPYKKIGESCSGSNQCERGLQCGGNKCVAASTCN